MHNVRHEHPRTDGDGADGIGEKAEHDKRLDVFLVLTPKVVNIEVKQDNLQHVQHA